MSFYASKQQINTFSESKQLSRVFSILRVRVPKPYHDVFVDIAAEDEAHGIASR